MQLFKRSTLKTLRKKVSKIPDPSNNLDANQIKAWLEKSHLIMKEIEKALHNRKINDNEASELRKIIQEKGLKNQTIQMIVTDQIRKNK